MKTEQNPRLIKIITWLAGVVAMVFTLALPLVFFLFSIHQEKAILITETEINGPLVEHIVAASPELWRFRTQHLEELLRRRPRDGAPEIRRLVGLDGATIAQSGDALAEPIVWRSADILDSGVAVARVEIGRSLRTILYQTAGCAIVGLAFGLAVFMTLRTLPLRALRRALAANHQLVESLVQQKADLLRTNAAMEITRRQMEQQANELMVARDAAEAATQAKSDFLANMSHELRTPLHGILSFANYGLKNGATAEPKKLHRYFSTIRDSGMTLLGLVNDVLDLAKLEAGKMSLDKRQVDIKALVATVVDEFESMTRDKNVSIQLLNFDNNHKIQADSTRIMQVVRNLLSNALKFSPEQASVSISAREEHRSLLISVADEGPGIPANEVEAIFDKFVQSSKTRTGAGGTGLGLAICREIIAVHGGTIWAENNPGRGAVFSFALPLAASDEIEGKEQAPVAEPELLAL